MSEDQHALKEFTQHQPVAVVGAGAGERGKLADAVTKRRARVML